MTLYRQLVMTIIALFTACFLASVTISTGNLRDFLVEQLEAHAQDTATSLGLSLSPYMQRNDTPFMHSMVDAIFDRGYYKTIRVIATDGNILIERRNSVTGTGVPAWFIDYVALRVPTARAVVMSGWKQAASVVVESHPGHAYQKLWKNTVDTFWLFLLTGITAVMLGMTAVYLLLKPLRRVEDQAEAICQRTLAVQDRLPRTRELRRVVEAMNSLATKVNSIFAEQSAMSERLREQAYKDPVSGVGNRRYFDRQLHAVLEARDEPTTGAIMLLDLHHLEQTNTASGYEAGDRVLRRTAELVQSRLPHLRNCFAARISGGGFGIVAGDLNSREADTLAASLSGELLQLHTEKLVEYKDIANIGVAMWKSGDAFSAVLAEADMALRSARCIGANAWYRYESPLADQIQRRGAAQWNAYLKQAVSVARPALFAQAVHRLTRAGDELVHKEILLRLPDISGEFLTAGVFMPMAERTGLAIDLDKAMTNRLLEYLEASRHDSDLYALNLTSTSLHDRAFVEWLCSRLQAVPDAGRRLVFELPEFGVLRDIPATRAVVERLSTLGCRCGIDHFGRGFTSFGYLQSIRVQYLKIDGSYTRNIKHEADNQFFIRALADAAHSLDIAVIAEAVESEDDLAELRLLNIDGIQGYLVGKPEMIQPACAAPSRESHVHTP
jgi:diguanylate cyclase (GGDEF)-like protein